MPNTPKTTPETKEDKEQRAVTLKALSYDDFLMISHLQEQINRLQQSIATRSQEIARLLEAVQNNGA